MEQFPLEFVDIEKVNPSIVLDIWYATPQNFTSQKLYPFPKCFLRKKVAEKMDSIQKRIKKRGLGLKIFDGYRPLGIQKIFWQFLPDDRYIANPSIGSKHNRGAAIDVTLIDEKGKELLMPTPYDSFSEKAHRDCFDLPKKAILHRKILEDIMGEEGFIPLATEWWHFDDKDWEKYPIEDISFEELIVLK